MKKKYKKSQLMPIIEGYFTEAKTAFKKDQKKANNYVRKARRLAMKYKLRLPRALKRRFCKHCYSYLVPSINCRVRLQKRRVIYYCFNCRKYMRFPYIRKK